MVLTMSLYRFCKALVSACHTDSFLTLTKELGQNSVQLSCSGVSDSLQPHGLQHVRLSCPSPTPEPAQTHVHQIGNSIQPSHFPSSSSPPAFNLSQHHGLFQ